MRKRRFVVVNREWSYGVWDSHTSSFVSTHATFAYADAMRVDFELAHDPFGWCGVR